MFFRLVGSIRHSRTIATGRGIRELPRLRRIYGRRRWRKRAGEVYVQLGDGRTRLAEVHWYEAGGIGQREHKIKQFLD